MKVMMIVIKEEANIHKSAINFLQTGAMRGVSRTKIVLVERVGFFLQH